MIIYQWAAVPGAQKLYLKGSSSLRDNHVYVVDISDGINSVENGPNPIRSQTFLSFSVLAEGLFSSSRFIIEAIFTIFLFQSNRP